MTVRSGNATFIHNGKHGELSSRDVEQLSRLIPLFLDLETDHRRNLVIRAAKAMKALEREHAKIERRG
jgi:hypothetical protein